MDYPAARLAMHCFCWQRWLQWFVWSSIQAMLPPWSQIVALALLLGLFLVMPIGGADMPVVIALLNSYSGIAAALAGFILGNTY